MIRFAHILLIILYSVSILTARTNSKTVKECLSSPDNSVREHILSEIIISPKRFPDKTTEMILSLFRTEKNSTCRRLMVDAIAALKPKKITSDLNSFVIMAMNDTDQYVRHSAISLIGSLNQIPSNFITKLVTAVSDSCKPVFECAQNTLIKLGEFSVRPLMEQLNKKETTDNVKYRIVYIFKELGDEAQKALPMLKKMSMSSNKKLSKAASEALQYLEM